MAGEPLPTSWASEGAAMRRALAAEFAAARPAPRVVVATDPRLTPEEGPWRTAVVESVDRLEALAREADCTLLIAPETNGILEGLVRRLRRLGVRLLNASPEAIALAGDKAALDRAFRREGVPTPRTRVLEPGERPPGDWGYPAVVKPVDGAGSLDTFRVDGPEEFEGLPGREGRRLLQEYVPGRPLSATFLVGPSGLPQLLAIGEQRFHIAAGRFEYRGGMLPASDLAGVDVECLLRAVASVPGLEGLVGVDSILDSERGRTCVLEINPRATTSIVGILGLTRPGRLAEAWAGDDGEDEDARSGRVAAVGDEVRAAGPIEFSALGETRRMRTDARDNRLALDVGGANLKAAHDGGAVRTSPFPVWKNPDGLSAALRDLSGDFPPFASLAVTMTAELCDCFSTRREGVLRIVEAVGRAFPGVDARYWGTDGRFHNAAAVSRDPLVAAASNWLALATVAARLAGDAPAVLIDVGTTTTDVIPIRRGAVAARGRTDTDRLRHGELVYAGVARTPVCTVAVELPFQGALTGLAAEWFATTRDVYQVLGDLPDDPDDATTADGRPATRRYAADRLARMVCTDRDSCSAEDVLDLAREADAALFQRLLAASRRACSATVGTPALAVVSGSGEFLARRVAEALVGPSATVRSLAELWGPAASEAACARALLELTPRGEGRDAAG